MADWSPDSGLDDPASSPLRALVRGFPGAAAHVSGEQIWLNSIAEAVVGYRNDELETVTAWGLAVHGAREEEAREVYLTARSGGFPRPEVLTITRADGQERVLEFSAYRGELEEIWVMRDITDIQRAERELREREQRLQVAVTTAQLGTWEWDVTAGSISGDATTRRMFGLGDSRGTDPLSDYLDRVIVEDRPEVESAMGLAVESAAGFDVELRVAADHGRSRWLRIHGTVVDGGDSDRDRVIGAVGDIDSYKRLDERLVHAATMESLGQLAGGVAHDFNNLLAVILGHVEFVARDPNLTEKNAVRLETVERAVAKGAEMVSSLLQLGRSNPSRVEVIDVNDLLTENRDTLDQIVGADVTVDLVLEAAEPRVRFDEARLSGVILNLATNARDAMPIGGLLSIVTENVPDGSGRSPGTGSWLELRVEDTGVGMDAATRERIFEPFFTTKAPGVGTGLGLASVYDAVLDAGGTVDVESTPGTGTTFVVTLPCVDALVEPTSADEASPPPRDSGARTVLVVEDEPPILEMTADILRSAGYVVIEALGPDAALEAVRTGPRPDVLLTDVVMPGRSGPRLAESLRQEIPGLPVLYMSGYTSEGRGDLAMDDSELIHKPFSHGYLIDRIAALLDGS